MTQTVSIIIGCVSAAVFVAGSIGIYLRKTYCSRRRPSRRGAPSTINV
jgi:hypothetical protein